MLSASAQAAFAALEDQARRDGVTATGNLPFYLGTPKTNAAVLLVHGFTASPYEMRSFAEHLQAHDLCCLAVRLPGHGTSPEDLAQRRWTEWLDAVEQGYQLLRSDFPRVYGAGLSTGCLLLMALALQRPLSGAVLFSPYLKVRHRLAPLAEWLHPWRAYHTVDVPAAQCAHYYARRPVAGVGQINRLLRHLRPRLGEIGCPVLAFNSRGDRTVVGETGRQLVERLGSRTKIHQLLGAEAPHVLTGSDNPHRTALFRMASEFFLDLELAQEDRVR